MLVQAIMIVSAAALALVASAMLGVAQEEYKRDEKTSARIGFVAWAVFWSLALLLAFLAGRQ